MKGRALQFCLWNAVLKAKINKYIKAFKVVPNLLNKLLFATFLLTEIILLVKNTTLPIQGKYSAQPCDGQKSLSCAHQKKRQYHS